MNQAEKLPYDIPECQIIQLEPEYNMLNSGSTKDLNEYEDL